MAHNSYISILNSIRPGGCLVRIRSHMPSLNKSYRKIAEKMLKDPNSILTRSIIQFSELAGVSTASVSRFCRLLGYAGYSEMKSELRVDLLSPETKVYPQIKLTDSISQIVEKVCDISSKGIAETLKLLDTVEVERAANSILKADKVAFFGIGGSSGPISQLAAYKFMGLGITTGAYIDPLIQQGVAEQLKERDVVFGISHSGEAQSIVDSLKKARTNGATTICLTNYAGSSIIAVSDIKLLTAIQKGSPLFGEHIPSRIPQLCIIDSLYSIVCLMKLRGEAVEYQGDISSESHSF
jgi:RpiR family carbohydrate utilization transcriptional regulator